MNLKINGLTEKEQIGIAFFVSKGFREGIVDDLDWSIDFDEKEISPNEIGDMINQGYTNSSEYPEWSLSFTRKSVLGHEVMDDYRQETLWRIRDEEIHDALVEHDIPQDEWVVWYELFRDKFTIPDWSSHVDEFISLWKKTISKKEQ